MVTNYGNVFIVYRAKIPHTKGARYDVHGLSKAQVIKKYKDWVSGLRQSTRVSKDLAALKDLPKGKYSVTSRQRVGHRYTGSLTVGKEMFSSSAIHW